MTSLQKTPSPSSAPPQGMALLSSPDKMKALWSAAANLANTKVVPQHFRGRPEEVFGAMLLLDGLGAHPITGLRLVYEVKGNLGVQAKLKIATCIARGAFDGPITWTETGKSGGLRDGHSQPQPYENMVLPGDYAVTAEATTHDGTVVDQTISLADAVKMGWTKRGAKGGPNARWEVPAMQQRMLRWRTADWLIEQYAPHVSNGVRSYDELLDMDAAGDLEPRDVTPEDRELEALNAEAVGGSIDTAPAGEIAQEEIPF